MFYVPTDLSDKIKLLQDSLSAIPLDEVKALVRSDLVVAKLKGESTAIDILSQISCEFERLQREIHDLNTLIVDSNNLKQDFRTLLMCLNKGMGDGVANSDFNTLKSRHSVY